MLKRKEARENAFILIFEKCFNDLSIDEILELAVEYRDFEYDEFTESVFRGVYDNLSDIDKCIETNSKGWNVDRIGKVAISVLRLSIYEMKYREDIPIGVSANEAVELCKKYASEEDASFVNGILGTVARSVSK